MSDKKWGTFRQKKWDLVKITDCLSKKISLGNSSKFSRFLTGNYIVFLDPHEELKTEKNDMPSDYPK